MPRLQMPCEGPIYHEAECLAIRQSKWKSCGQCHYLCTRSDRKEYIVCTRRIILGNIVVLLWALFNRINYLTRGQTLRIQSWQIAIDYLFYGRLIISSWGSWMSERSVNFWRNDNTWLVSVFASLSTNFPMYSRMQHIILTLSFCFWLLTVSTIPQYINL